MGTLERIDFVDFLDRSCPLGPFRITDAAFIAIRHADDEEAEVGELLAAIRDDVRRYREAGMTGSRLFF